MAEKTPAEKMRFKAGMSAALLDAPAGTAGRLGLPADVVMTGNPREAGFVLVFVSTQAEAEASLGDLATWLAPTTLAWLAYPKGSKAAGYDLSRDTIWAFAQTIGLTAVANVAIDSTWSALRLRPLAA
jgi:hypothetical protein